MTALIIFTALLTVLSALVVLWIWNGPSAPDTSSIMSIFLIVAAFGFLISLILWGVVFGMMIGSHV